MDKISVTLDSRIFNYNYAKAKKNLGPGKTIHIKKDAVYVSDTFSVLKIQCDNSHLKNDLWLHFKALKTHFRYFTGKFQLQVGPINKIQNSIFYKNFFVCNSYVFEGKDFNKPFNTYSQMPPFVGINLNASDLFFLRFGQFSFSKKALQIFDRDLNFIKEVPFLPSQIATPENSTLHYFSCQESLNGFYAKDFAFYIKGKEEHYVFYLSSEDMEYMEFLPYNNITQLKQLQQKENK
ncbi:hypothetical protein [Helicobacter mesocricetorum]|uniref:hypothetical protein n=1 Tax=Helicobacter mesocricetorum TaxID=87012 RepID=UPI000CF0BCAD|nr:hypothetical protein [Helicobacter mesocricetorum]